MRQEEERGILKMSTSTELDTIIPYERQSDPRTNRDCGAACLSMVYRCFGKDVAPAQIWPAIGKQNPVSYTHLTLPTKA